MEKRYDNEGAGEGKASLLADHPDPETIVAYRRRALAEQETGRIEEHLEHCAECLDLLLLGDESEGSEEPGVLDFEKEMVWARLKAARMEEDVQQARRRAAEALVRRRRERFRIAAAVLAVLVPLGGFTLHQSNVISDLTRPQPNVSIHDILKNGHRNIEEVDPETMAFQVPRDTEYYTLIFPVETRREGVYWVELLDSRNRRVWRGHGLEVDEFGYATLGLSRRFLAQGAYKIRVYEREGDETPIGDYAIVIRYE